MRSLLVFSIVVLVLVATAQAEYHRYCGAHEDCEHPDKANPKECCIRNPKMNNYHECLANPKPGTVCDKNDLN